MPSHLPRKPTEAKKQVEQAAGAAETEDAHAPILVICFDRPEKAALLLAGLRTHKGKLFLFRDGGGSWKFERLFADAKSIRPHGATETLIEKDNLGGRDGPWRAIRWFFSQVPAGIVLEEDITPAKAMVACYSKALETFAADKSVFALGAAPNRNVRAPGPHPWTRSPLFLPWGWASWSDRILGVDVPNDIWKTRGKSLLRKFDSLTARLYLGREMRKLAADPQYCWSYYPQLHALASGLDILIPETKLTKNTGISRKSRRSKTNPDSKPVPQECAAMARKPAGANPKTKAWQKEVEKAKFMGLGHEIRNRLRLGTRLRALGGLFDTRAKNPQPKKKKAPPR